MPTLNAAQLSAVTHPGGPALVLAGAGTGKTRVIVERLAWLVDELGVDPRSLLALTFTNRAASEMRTRTAERLGLERFGAWVGTFHSFGLYILRREMDKLGRPKDFTVIDAGDQLSLMKRLVKELPEKWVRVSPRGALNWISLHKQDLKEPEGNGGSPEIEAYTELWRRYHQALQRSQAVDFDDLLGLVVRLFEEHVDVRDRYSRRYKYVHVDEYQDTNRAQYLIASKLSGAHGNLFVVGDEDQSIYSWRGASIRNILDFERDFPGASVYRLEDNYRSTAQILSVANAVVAHNEHRLGKTLRTQDQGGELVGFYEADDADDEARFVADDIVDEALVPSGTAVLFRTNGQSRLMEEALRKKGLAYVVVGGVSFYGRKEVKDILAYMRLVANRGDEESLRRVINVPTRGIGGQTMAQLEEYRVTRGLPLWDVLRDVEHDQTLSVRARQSIADFVNMIGQLEAESRTLPVAKLAESLLDKTRYRDYIKATDERDFRTGLEYIDEFVSACAQHDERGGGDLAGFLQELSLMSDVDGFDPSAPAVKLMTCHSAKGLEFDNVFLIGLEEGFLPHASSLESEAEVEEERRLCYVAMTRARKRLILTAARTRLVYGERRDREMSRFLGEIPRDRLRLLGARAVQVRAAAAKPESAPQADAGEIRMGTRVRHAKFGSGIVMYTKGSGQKLRVRIRFETGRIREFMVSAAPLEILEGKKR